MTRRKTTTIRRGLQMHPLIIMQRPLFESEIVKLLFCGVGKRFIEIW